MTSGNGAPSWRGGPMNKVGRTQPGIRGSSKSDSTYKALPTACSASSCGTPCLSALFAHVNDRAVVYYITWVGYTAGPDQSLEHPLGEGGEQLHRHRG